MSAGHRIARGKRGVVLFAAAVAVSSVGCKGKTPTETKSSPSASPAVSPSPGGIALTSPDFNEGADIPKTFSCDGENRSPRLEWSGTPQSAQELALEMTDPDAPSGTFIHWIVYGLSPTEKALDSRSLPAGAKQGRNSAGRNAYAGPCPPKGSRHGYVFTLFALSEKLDLAEGASAAKFEEAVPPAELQRAVLDGKFGR